MADIGSDEITTEKLDVAEMRMLKLTFRKYPAIHTNYIISHCTTLKYNII